MARSKTTNEAGRKCLVSRFGRESADRRESWQSRFKEGAGVLAEQQKPVNTNLEKTSDGAGFISSFKIGRESSTPNPGHTHLHSKYKRHSSASLARPHNQLVRLRYDSIVSFAASDGVGNAKASADRYRSKLISLSAANIGAKSVCPQPAGRRFESTKCT